MDGPDSIRFQCPHCSKRLRVAAKLAGRKVHCPNEDCRQPISVPLPLDDEPAPRPQSPRKATTPLPGRPPSQRERESIVPPVPQKRTLRWPWYVGGGTAALSIVAVLVFIFARPSKDRTPAKNEIAALTLPEPKPESNPTEPKPESNPTERGRNPAQRFTRDEVVKLLKDAGFEVSDGGVVSQGQTLDGEISLSSSEVDCVHNASKRKLKLKTSSQTFNKTGQTLNTMVLSADRSPAVEAAFKAFAEQFHKSCTDAYTQALKTTNDGGGEKGKSVGSLRIIVTKDRITFEFAVRSSSPDPNPATPTSPIHIDPAKLIGRWKSISGPVMIEFTRDSKITGVATSAGQKINFAGTYKLDGQKLVINFKVDENEIKRTMTIIKLTDDDLEFIGEDGEKETLKKANTK